MPPPVTEDIGKLRAEVERAILKEIATFGKDGFSKTKVLKPFMGRAGRSTLFRWLDQVLASGKPAAHLDGIVRRAAAKRAKMAEGAAGDAVAMLPPPVHIGDLAASQGGAAIPFVERLQDCLAHADILLRHATTDDGKPRNARLMLAASEHIRRTLETAARIQDSLLQVREVERFHQAVFDVLREESPGLAERVLLRLRQLNAQWSGR